MRIGVSYKHFQPDARYDAIVIGSGMGGLASAAILAKHAGKRVLVLERHYTAGGFTHSFRRPGYEWDVGVHYIGEVNRPTSTLRRVFDDVTDGELEWADMGEVYDTFDFAGERFPMRTGLENLRADLHGWFPREKPAIDRYLELVLRATKRSQLYYMEKALPSPVATVFGPLLREPALRTMRKTTLETLSELTRDKELIGVLTGQWGDYGLPPAEGSFFMHAMVAAHYFRGAAYAVGGASRIAETIEPVINRTGGAVVTNAEVKSIVVEGGRAVGVSMEDGRVIRAPLVLSGAGVATTFGRLLSPEAAERCRYKALEARIKPSGAHASLYLGFEKTAAVFELPKRMLWLSSR
jgi:all-trans-retinol 13,14-reductase